MRLVVLLSLPIILLGCLTSSYEASYPPLKWGKGQYFYSKIELPGGHPYLSVGIRPTEKDHNLLIPLKSLKAKCSIKNEGPNNLKISWIASNNEEKKQGELDVKFDNGEEDRRIVLKENEELIWHSGEFGEIIGSQYLMIQDFGKNRRWYISLKLEFENPNQLKKIVNVSKLTIPISAYCSDNI
jgi:hypothetical protein